MRRLFVLLLCAGCCAPPEALTIPPEATDCPRAPIPPAVPPPPRTLAVVVAFANENALALARTEAALAVCRARLLEVVQLAGEHR